MLPQVVDDVGEGHLLYPLWGRRQAEELLEGVAIAHFRAWCLPKEIYREVGFREVGERHWSLLRGGVRTRYEDTRTLIHAHRD